MAKKQDEDLPHRDRKQVEAMAREAEKNRRELDEIPEPGSDPLHEGP